MPAGMVTSALTGEALELPGGPLGGLEVEVDLGDGILRPDHDLLGLHLDLGLDLLAVVVDDLHLVGLELQEHGAKPGLPGRFELHGRRGRAGPEVADLADLLQLDPERPAVQDRRLGHRPAADDADRAVAGVEVDAHLGLPRDQVQRLQERLVADLQVQRGVGHLGPELFAHVGDRIAGLLLELLQGLGQPDPFACEGDPAGVGIDLVLRLAQGRAELSIPSLRLPAGRVAGSGRIGKIFGPSLVRLAIAASRASALGASRRSTSWSTRSRKAASVASDWPRAARAGSPSRHPQATNQGRTHERNRVA